MTIEELVKLHEETCGIARATMIKKSHDYTNGSADPFANFRISAVVGVDPRLALLVRVMDKIKRLETFINKGELKVNESFDDAIQDIINYMILLQGLSKELK